MKREEDEPDPPPPVSNLDGDLFDSALQVEGPDDGAIDNPNAET